MLYLYKSTNTDRWGAQTCEQNSTGSRCLVQLLSADRSVWGSTRGGAAISVEGWVKLSKAGYLLSTDHLTSSGSRISTLSVYLNETHVVVGHEREQAGTVQVIHSAFPLPKVRHLAFPLPR